MAFFWRNPLFYAVLTALLGVCAAGLWYLTEQRAQLAELKRSFDAKSLQYTRYHTARPSPTKTNLIALEENYAELYSVYERAMAELDIGSYDRVKLFGETPDSRAAWSYAINRYIAGARMQAQGNGILLPSNATFGFSDPGYVPPEDAALYVHEQIVLMNELLEMLFSSRITSFDSIQRGAKPVEARKGARPSANRAPRVTSSVDEFLVPSGLTAAIPDTISTYAFRLVFTGQSLALRNFLNNIVASRLPFAIREIEVGLASEAGVRNEQAPTAGNPFATNRASRNGEAPVVVPIIAENISRFVVTLEFLDLAVAVPPPLAGQAMETEAPDA